MREQPVWQEFRSAEANQDIVVRGDVSEHTYVLCFGWAIRYHRMKNGSRQISHILLPGDLFSAATAFEVKLFFSVQAMTEIRFSRFKRANVQAMLSGNPAIFNALLQSCVAQSMYTDELITVLGQGSAEQRLAYLFLHITKRVSTRSVVREQRYPFPLRQHHIAEALGLTSVHVSRTIRSFRDRGLVELSGGHLTILNHAEIERIGVL